MNIHDAVTEIIEYAKANGRNSFEYLEQVANIGPLRLSQELRENWSATFEGLDEEDLDRACKRFVDLVELARDIRKASVERYREEVGHNRYCMDVLVWESEEDSEAGQRALHAWYKVDIRIASWLD